MAVTPLLFLLTIVTTGQILADSETGSQVSRQKRSDDGGPLEAVVEHQSQQLTALNAQLTAVNAKVAALEARTSTLDKTVAFYVWNDANPLQALPHGILIFSLVATNIGKSYDKDTGVFTAPLSGLYDFQASIVGYHVTSGTAVRAGIYVDGRQVARCISDNRHGANYDQNTMKAIVHVSAGSKVAVRNTDSVTSDYYVSTNYPETAFSGFLIKAD